MFPSSARAAFDCTDPFDFNDQLNEEERLVRNSARDYAQEKLLPRVTSAYLDERFDREIMNEMGELGLLGTTIPAEYGVQASRPSPDSAAIITPRNYSA